MKTTLLIIKIRAAILENRYNEQRIKHMNAHLEKLKEQEINEAMEKILKAVEKDFGAVLRG